MLKQPVNSKKNNQPKIPRATILAALGIIIILNALPAAAKPELGGAYITSFPPGAEIRLDDEVKGSTPAILSDLPAGIQYIKLYLPGYLRVVTTIEITAGKLKDFKYHLKPNYGHVTVLTTPEGADVFLDGKYVGKSPRRIGDLLRIKHWIKVNQTGYKPWEQEIKLDEEKATEEIKITLEKIHLPDGHDNHEKGDCQTKCHDLKQSGATLEISSTPSDATVYLNGENKGKTPLKVHLYPNKYKLEIKKSDYEPQEKEITLDAKQKLNLDFTLKYQYSQEGMAYIPAGEFEMGDPRGASEEKPAHKVYLDAFYIDKFEVTNAQYRTFVKETGYRQPSYQYDRKWGADKKPVIGVSYEDAEAYAEWAGKRLPTEAEWEKAAKSGKIQRYPWGNKWQPAYANTLESRKGGTAEVGSYLQDATPYGVYDMLGNVAEWCSDWYSLAYYQSSPKRNPKGPPKGRTKVIRGGSWNTAGKSIGISTRNSLSPKVRLNSVGFRCVKDIE